MKPPLTLPNIRLKHSVKSVMLKADLKKVIMEELQNYSELGQLKLHPELTKYVCQLLENTIFNNKTKKIDKKALCISILGEILNLSGDERLAISLQIDFLFENGHIHKKTLKLLGKSFLKLSLGCLAPI